MQFLRDENGSTLLMTVITIAVLTVLGTTVLSLSIMNYNMKYTDTMLKRTQYYSESGIDQVYSILGNYVDQALEEASDNTTNAVDSRKTIMSTILGNVRKLENDFGRQLTIYENKILDGSITMPFDEFVERKLYLKDYLNGLAEDKRVMLFSEFSDDIYYEGCFLKVMYKSGSGEYQQYTTTSPNPITDNNYYSVIIDEESMTRYYNERMNYFFKADLDAKISEIESAISFSEQKKGDAGSSFVFLDAENVTLNEITVEDIENFDQNTNGTIEKSENEFIVKNLKSTFTYSDRTRKTIETDIYINAPEEMMPIKLNQSKYVTVDNPLWQYALVTETDILFDEVMSDITGSIYALGTTASNLRDITGYNGVKVMNDNNDITIHGDVVTQSFVQLAGNARNSILTINNGHIYSDSLAIQAGSSNSIIEVNNGNVYTKNDLVLNGIHNKIDIDGNYYGYIGRANEYYLVSSIVINADIGASTNPSELSITGETPNHPKGVKEAIEVGGETKDGIIIAGTSFVNDIFSPNPNTNKGTGLLNDTDLFETGESMGIKGNYLAYAFPDGAMKDPAVGASSNLQLYYQYDDKAQPMSVYEKALFFIKNSKDPLIEPYIETGSGNIHINQDSYLYTEGAVMGVGSETIQVHHNNPNDIQVHAEENILKDYIVLLNYLRHFDEIDTLTSIHGWTGVADLKSIITGTENARVVTNYSTISDSSDVIESADIRETDNLVDPTETAKEVAIFQGNSATNAYDILLLGDNSGISVNDGIRQINGETYYVINAVNGKIQGIILTNKKVDVIGDLEFSGSIIAKDTIQLKSGTIDIINNDLTVRDYLTQLVMESPKLSEAFNPNVSDSSHPLNGLSLVSIQSSEEIEVGLGDVTIMRKNYDEYIDLKNWRVADER
jgi:uncharacterized membrane protein